MSKLNYLINELCPDGVEYVKIKDTFQRLKGTPITAGKMKEIARKDGEIKIFAGGKTVINANEEDIPKANITKVPAVLVQSRGVIDFICYDKPFTFKNEMWAYTANDKTTVKYLYYVLQNNKQYFRDFASGMGSLPQISLPVTEDFKIPVPPLEVQREIVRILDMFTEYTELLSKELELRKKQYSYYRDKLLTFGDDVEYKKLGDIGKVSMCKRIMKNQTNAESGVPFFKIGTFGKKADSYISFDLFNEYKQKYSYPKKGDILISASGTIGRIVIFNGEPAYFQDSNIIWIDNDETIVLNKFLYYFYQTNPWKISEGGTIARLYNDDLAKIKIPIPLIEEQERIVKILDKFDTLCNDLTNGIPAEIELRKKQYEYYRDKLLTFKELK